MFYVNAQENEVRQIYVKFVVIKYGMRQLTFYKRN